MFLSEIEIENYRTFRAVSMTFDPQVNYLVGGSRIGKSNFLTLLAAVFSGRGFSETDFLDATEPIRVRFTLLHENGGRRERVKIFLVQTVAQVTPRLYRADTGEEVAPEEIRRLLYVPCLLEDALSEAWRIPELSELCAFYSDGLAGTEEERAALAGLFSRYGLSVDLSGSVQEAALRLMQAVYGADDAPGEGPSEVQTLVAAASYLLLSLYKRKKSAAVPFSEMVLEGEDGKRYLPLLVGIDEPELRLHPFQQRSVLSFLRKLLRNEDPVFVHFLQKVLGIDGLDGQIFVVTHSTDALVNDYRKIIRLYRKRDGEVAAACGARFGFDADIEKHLIMHFPEVKEALFAHCAVLVEGETEYGSFGYFAKTLGYSLNFYGICLINARGETSISRIAELLRKFHVASVSLYDRDVAATKRASDTVFFTDTICYEMDVAKHCLPARRSVLDAAAREVDGGDPYVSGAFIKKAAAKLGIERKAYAPKKLANVTQADRETAEFYYFAWFYGNKGVITGRALGLHLQKADIPPAFRKVLDAAVEKAKVSR